MLVGHITKVGTTLMKGKTRGRLTGTPDLRNPPGKPLAGNSSREVEDVSPPSHHDQPRASSRINELLCNQVTDTTAGREHTTDNKHWFKFKCKASCCITCSFCTWTFPKERIKSRVSRLSLQKLQNKVCEKCFLCHSIVLCSTCNKCQKCCTKSACRGKTSELLANLAGPGSRSKSSSDPKRGLHPSLPDPAKAHKVTQGCQLLCQSPQGQLPVGGITSAHSQKCCRTSKKPNFSGVFQQTIFSPKTQQQVATYPRSEQTESFPQGGEIQDGNTGNHQDVPPTRGVGHLNRFQGRILPYTNTGTVQEISEISCPRSDIPVQGPALWSVHSTLGVYCDSKGGETDGQSQGYKDPPVPRRLVGESHIPPGLSPTYSKSGRKSELDPKQIFDFVGYQFDLRAGQVRPTPDRWQNLQDKILEIMSLPNCPVRQFMSLIGLLTATEKQVHLGRLHMRPIQWHLKQHWRIPESLEKVIPIPSSLHPH